MREKRSSKALPRFLTGRGDFAGRVNTGDLELELDVCDIGKECQEALS